MGCNPLPLSGVDGRLCAVNDTEFQHTVEQILARIAAAAEKSGRSPDDVTILPITKGQPYEVLHRVVEAGFQAIGENRVAEAQAKQSDLGTLGLRWHMVGHLQRNKAARAVRLFDVIESVDTLALGTRLQHVAEREGLERLPVLVQVSVAGEEQKSGFSPAAVVEAVGRLCELDRLAVDGLMTMAPLTSEERLLRDSFRRTREAMQSCQRELASFAGSTLSMGMSNDYQIAVEEGSTEVRLGTVLLGARPGG